MNKTTTSYKGQKAFSNFLVNLTLIIICVIWLVPTLGILITSFRNSEDIFKTGWWTVFPHKAFIKSGEINIDPAVDVNGPITIDGVTHTFEEWRAGVVMADGSQLTWYGNKRTRLIEVQALEWQWFETSLSLEN